MVISYEASYRFKRARDKMLSDIKLDPRDREKHQYWINDMMRNYARTLARVCSEAGIKMAKKSEKFKWNGFVNVDIPSSKMKEAESYIADDKKVFADYSQVLVDGYKVSASRDPETESINVTLTCFDRDSENYGYAMGGFGSDWYTALGAALYKHYYLLKERWDKPNPSEGRRFG